MPRCVWIGEMPWPAGRKAIRCARNRSIVSRGVSDEKPFSRACRSRSKSACRICRTCSGSMPGLGRTHIVNHDQPFAFSASVFIVAGTNRSGTSPGSVPMKSAGATPITSYGWSPR